MSLPRVRLLAAMAALLVVGYAVTAAVPTRARAAAPASSATTTSLCGFKTTAPPSNWKHVIWIWMEKNSYNDIVGAPGSTQYARAPYINGTLGTQCGLATNFHNETHPSL